MNSRFFRTLITTVVAASFATAASANLVTDGTFTTVSYTGGTLPTGLSQSTLFGQFGTDVAPVRGRGGTPAQGSNLSVAGWSTGGYNYVFLPSTISGGTTSGANSGQPNEVAGQSDAVAGGFGNTYMWGAAQSGVASTGNGGVSTITAPPGGGNIIAADGAYEVDSIRQTVNNLTVGQTYALTFYYAGAQQQSYDGQTTDFWTVDFGNGEGTTPTLTVNSHDFSGWFQATMYFTASNTSQTLSFLATGTPNGEPPFSLLADVDLEVVPELSNWMIFAGFGAACILFEVFRRRRRRQGEFDEKSAMAAAC